MVSDFFKNIFKSEAQDATIRRAAAPLTGEIDKKFQPTKGSFFRTQDYPTIGADGKPGGKVWMEAGRNEKGNWVLWRKAIRTIDDALTGGTANILTADMMREKTDFITAYDEMTTFETAQEGLGLSPLLTKTPGKLGVDYYKQFAWREGLMMSRSGRLYPVGGETVNANNYFNQQDIEAAKEFLERLKTEQFVPAPLVLPSADWEKAYQDRKETTDERLRALYYRYKDDHDAYEMALQIVKNESPEVLYAHIKNGWKPNLYAGDPARHFALLGAAIERSQVDSLHLLTQAGMDFYVRCNDETPLELVLNRQRYSHLHVMLSRDGEKLANYLDEEGNASSTLAIMRRDRQAFRMLYLEGLDYAHTDAHGMALVHHAFDNSFIPGVYAWLDEGLSIDVPIKGTQLTGLSIARYKKDQPMIDFALKKGADPRAPDFPEKQEASVVKREETQQQPAAQKPAAPEPEPATPVFSPELLSAAVTNDQIAQAARIYAANGGDLNVLDGRGVSVIELCWQNRKLDPAYDRRALLPAIAALGADPAARLPDGTTVLTRITAAPALDMDFLKVLAPFAKNPGLGDANGNDLLHVLQMNTSEAVGHSNNVAAILALFPGLDVNRPNNEGLSNIGLALRLNRGQTLKKIPAPVMAGADLGQVTAAGWSLLDIAFTSAAAKQRVPGAARADSIVSVSDALRSTVLDHLTRIAETGSAAQKMSLADAFRRTRPDGKTFIQALTEEKAPASTISKLENLEKTLAPKHNP